MLLKLNLYLKIKFIVKLFFFFIFNLSIPFYKYFLRTQIGLLKFQRDWEKSDYIEHYNKLRDKYKNDLFLNSFLNEISIISYDFTDKLKTSNNKVHTIINMNNKYIYPSLVTINSILRNSIKNRTTIVCHILCPEDLKRGNINKLKSFLFLYPTNLEMIFYNMGNLFNENKRNRFSEVTFYRLLAPIFIPIEKVIYLDCDVLVFEDLEEMYNLPFNNHYILGNLDILSNGIDYLGLKSERYINAGVILLNLDLIRKDYKYYELLNMYKYYIKFNNVDQTIINYVFYPKIGILPSKFGIFNFDSIFDIKYIYLKSIRINLNLTELIQSFKHPAIMHYVLCNPKVWNSYSLFTKKYTRLGTINKSSCKRYHDIWIEYAKNTSFFKEIVKYYKIRN